jgi:hypothetical protein
MKAIDEKELARLKDIEAQWQALEAGGVDNWEGYHDAMAPYYEMKEAEAAYEGLADDILEVVGEYAYEPSERGAGFEVYPHGVDTLLELLKKKVTIK